MHLALVALGTRNCRKSPRVCGSEGLCPPGAGVEGGRPHHAEQDADPVGAGLLHDHVKPLQAVLAEVVRAPVDGLLHAVALVALALRGLNLVVLPAHLLLGPAEPGGLDRPQGSALVGAGRTPPGSRRPPGRREAGRARGRGRGRGPGPPRAPPAGRGPERAPGGPGRSRRPGPAAGPGRWPAPGAPWMACAVAVARGAISAPKAPPRRTRATSTRACRVRSRAGPRRPACAPRRPQGDPRPGPRRRPRRPGPRARGRSSGPASGAGPPPRVTPAGGAVRGPSGLRAGPPRGWIGAGVATGPRAAGPRASASATSRSTARAAPE